MESPDSVAAKRRVLVDALTLCLERSKVCGVVNAETLRSVIASAAGEMWREGSLRLEVVWKILCQQPGLSATEIAPPLFAFKSFEEVLGVQVWLPQALSALPRAEQAKLRRQIEIKSEDFAKTVAELKQLAEAGAAQAATRPSAPRPAPREPAARPAPVRPPAAKSDRKLVAIGLALVAVLAIGLALYSALADRSKSFDTSDTAQLVQLSHARRDGRSLIAHLDDARWNGLSAAQKRQLADQLFTLEAKKGIRVLTLSDGTGVRATVSDLTGTRAILIR